jgi:hypothetical protein
MSGAQRLIPWVIMGVLTVVALAGAALGLHQAPVQASLNQAVANTLAAPSYTSLLTVTGAHAETQYLVYQAPNRIGGYVDTGSKRIYVAVIGSAEFSSTQTSPSSSGTNLTFTQVASQPARSYDPVDGYLPYVKKGTNVTRDGDVYSFSVTNQGQAAKFTVTVSGQYVSQITITASTAHLTMDISNVGNSPAVALPAGAKVKAASGTGSSAGG